LKNCVTGHPFGIKLAKWINFARKHVIFADI